MSENKDGATSRRRAVYSVLALIGLPLTFVAGALTQGLFRSDTVLPTLTIAFFWVIPPIVLLICLIADRNLQRSAKSFPYGVILVYMLILGTIASSQRLGSPATSNEGAAVATLRSIHTAQTRYREKALKDVDDDGITDFGTLRQLQETSPPMLEFAYENNSRYGYRFTLTALPSNGGMPRYTCTARPVEPGRSGEKQFFLNESGEIRFTPDGATVGPSSPLLH